MMPKRWTVFVVTLLVLLAVGILIWRYPSPPPVVEEPSTAKADQRLNDRAPEADEELPVLDDLRQNAFRLQADRKWADAEQAWRDYMAKLPSDDAHRRDRDEVEGNLDLCKRQSSEPIVEVKILPPAEADRPKEVPARDVKAWYPKGRRIRSLAVASATGRGRTTVGVLQKPAYFAYQYVFELETVVVDNDGAAVEFEVAVKDVVQQLARCDEELELHLPDSPILEMVGGEADNYLRPIPAYRVFKTIAEIARAQDPHFKIPLTKFLNWLKLKGIKPLGPDVSVEVAAKVDELAGLRLRLRYVNGIGVTRAKVLEGHVSDRRVLERLARNSSLFADYFVGIAADKSEGETMELRADDLVGILALGYDVEASGDVMLRKAGEKSEDEDSWVKLEIERGEVTVDAPEASNARSVTVRPQQGGEIWFSPAQKLVRRAKLRWAATAYWESPNSLLFGMKYEGDVAIKTDYWAELKSK
jgi:hypothetical protein